MTWLSIQNKKNPNQDNLTTDLESTQDVTVDLEQVELTKDDVKI